MDLLHAFRIFVRVAEAGSFSAVGKDLGVTQPAVSRQLSALEAHLGVALVHRTTRSLSLTEDGRVLLGHARATLEAAERAENAVGKHRSGLYGLVRISAAITFGRVVIAPRIRTLLELYPGLEIDLRLDDTPQDMVQDGIDLSIRAGELSTASLVAQRIGWVSYTVVGSTDYLRRHREPQAPEDLAQHDCILLDRSDQPGIWRLTNGSETRDIHVNGRFRTDSAEAAREAVMSGVGLAILSHWLMRRALDAGTVRPLLVAWQPPRTPVYAMHPGQRNVAPRTRAVIDFLVREFRSDPSLSGVRDH